MFVCISVGRVLQPTGILFPLLLHIFEQSPALLTPWPQDEARRELQDLALMREAGFGSELDVWDAAEVNTRLGSRGYHGAIRMPRVGRVWAARLTLGLALEAAKHKLPLSNSTPTGSRLTLVEAAEVQAIEQAPAAESVPGAAGIDRPLNLRVRTSRSDAIDCRAVVHCTNAYASSLLPELQGRLVPVRNQVGIQLLLHKRRAAAQAQLFNRLHLAWHFLQTALAAVLPACR